jgi:hypothetical protein
MHVLGIRAAEAALSYRIAHIVIRSEWKQRTPRLMSSPRSLSRYNHSRSEGKDIPERREECRSRNCDPKTRLVIVEHQMTKNVDFQRDRGQQWKH